MNKIDNGINPIDAVTDSMDLAAERREEKRIEDLEYRDEMREQNRDEYWEPESDFL